MTTLEEGKSGEFRTFEDTSPKVASSGLCAFALTTFVLSINNSGSYYLQLPNIVVGLALFYGGLVQLIAGLWHLKAGNTFGATAAGSFGAFWLSYASNFIFRLTDFYIPEDPFAVDHAIGIYLLAWTIFTFLLTLAALKTNGATLLLFFFLNTAMVLLTLGKFYQLSEDVKGPNGLTKAGGVFGILTSLMAWYNAFAELITLETSYFTLPVYDLSHKRR
ncbi:2020_t:CDS:2 [Rhizophagus irregularis]|uniref:Ato2p n=1 Tax=Rhizophagus irregularis (strain DAOM 197198w) TaxID=1432141 RepID=A0A015KYN9_RHIIW|nr:Ato2p [Rhizophagus irregularis DAOM 197198w]CAG8718812.1 2020_t:CDS:2 [Rhizophagus irregularis]